MTTTSERPVGEWKLVPVEPLPEMIGAWYRVKNGHHFHDEAPPTDNSDYAAYRAMLASAPASPAIGVQAATGLSEETQCQLDAIDEAIRAGAMAGNMIVGSALHPAPEAASAGAAEETFQNRVQPWMMACFGPEISGDRVERGDRLLEEVFELLQSGGYDPARVPALRDYVWGREKGEPVQEVGGVMVTLAAYCLAHELDMHEAGETELARIWTKVEKIRAKQAAKPVGSLASPAGMEGWMPIETAPKDGTPILVYFTRPSLGVQRVFFGDLDGDPVRPGEDGMWLINDNKHGPYPLRGYSEGDDSHWMPLPAAPRGEAE